MNNKLIIFDIDGTITDTTEVDDLCFKKTFKLLYDIDLINVTWSDYPHATDWGLSMSIIEEKFNISLSTNEKRKIEKHFIEILQGELSENPQKFAEIPESVKFIKSLINSNQPIAIATGAWKHSALLKLKKVGLDIKGIPFANSDEFYSREEITKHAITKAENQYNIKFKKFVYFGDGTWDYKTTKSLGIPLIGVDFHSNGKLKKLGVKNIISDYTKPIQIMTILDKI